MFTDLFIKLSKKYDFSSPMSDTVRFITSGAVPSQPDPPMLSERFIHGLCISWIRRPNDDNFILQMEDVETVIIKNQPF